MKYLAISHSDSCNKYYLCDGGGGGSGSFLRRECASTPRLGSTFFEIQNIFWNKDRC